MKVNIIKKTCQKYLYKKKDEDYSYSIIKSCKK